MQAWRIARGWTGDELRARLDHLPSLDRNFGGTHDAHREHPSWETHDSRSLVGSGPPGPPRPDGAFVNGRTALEAYAFSDPAIVEAHFDPAVPLEDRRMLLELKVPLLRYLCGVVVGAVRDSTSAAATTFGFRYDTLEGHIESGSEWFLLEKDHESGDITFSVEASWRPGEFPNWWSRLGFAVVGRYYQRRWHIQAHRRMAAFVDGWPVATPLSARRLAHQGPDVVFTRGVRE